MYGAPLTFKQPEDEPKIAGLDWRIRFLLRLVQLYAWAAGYKAVRITDVDTPDIHMAGGPHYRKQGLDLGLIGGDPAFTLELAEWINAAFAYGRGFHVAITGPLDPTGGHNDHLHLQVPPPFQAEGQIRL
jgi:hypothetical protein